MVLVNGNYCISVQGVFERSFEQLLTLCKRNSRAETLSRFRCLPDSGVRIWGGLPDRLDVGEALMCLNGMLERKEYRPFQDGRERRFPRGRITNYA